VNSGESSAVESTSRNGDCLAQNDTASDLPDTTCSDATQIIKASANTDSAVVQNVSNRCMPNSASATVLSHQALTFDSVTNIARKPVLATQRENSRLMRSGYINSSSNFNIKEVSTEK